MKARWIACALLLSTCGPVLAFSIDPFPSPIVIGERYEYADHISSGVHEQQTEAALLLAGKPPDAATTSSCRTARLGLPAPRYNREASALIRGVRWPDDPNQLLPEEFPKWLGWMMHGHKVATTGTTFLGRKAAPWPDYFMNYRGHFGDMQQMHAMANQDKEKATDVRDRIVAWTKFLYSVATCQVKPEAFISKQSVASHFPRKAGWTVHYLLNPSKSKPVRAQLVPEVAAGALLHVVQDSYSEAHVARDLGVTTDCPHGRVIRFNSYVKQNPFRHGRADTSTAWLKGDRPPEKTAPVLASFRIIEFIRSNADWDSVVEPFMTKELFCVGSDAKESGPGGF